VSGMRSRSGSTLKAREFVRPSRARTCAGRIRICRRIASPSRLMRSRRLRMPPVRRAQASVPIRDEVMLAPFGNARDADEGDRRAGLRRSEYRHVSDCPRRESG
jgi:hypothetical protein